MAKKESSLCSSVNSPQSEAPECEYLRLAMEMDLEWDLSDQFRQTNPNERLPLQLDGVELWDMGLG